MFEIDGVKFIV